MLQESAFLENDSSPGIEGVRRGTAQDDARVKSGRLAKRLRKEAVIPG